MTEVVARKNLDGSTSYVLKEPVPIADNAQLISMRVYPGKPKRDPDYEAFKREIDAEMRRLHKAALACGPADAPTGASNPDACVVQAEVPKLYCPACGKMENDELGVPAQFYMGGKKLCPKCVTEALERIGAHQLVEKPPQQVKKW